MYFVDGLALTTMLVGFIGMVITCIDLFYRWKKLKNKD